MDANVVFKEENESLFWKLWEDYIANRATSPRYLRLNIEWGLSISKARLLFYRDKSFIFVENGKPAAIVFLPLERVGGRVEAAMVGSYIYAPLFLNNSIAKKVFLIIEEIALAHQVERIKFAVDTFEANYNYLQKYNFLDSSIISYVVDLDCPHGLLESCRKGLRHDLIRVTQDPDFKLFVIDSKNASFDNHEEYRALHFKCSGRATRPKETFDLQFQKLLHGQAILVGVTYKQKNIAYAYFEYNADKAIYASGADDPDYDSLPLYHALVFAAMEYFKNNGVRYIDTGQPSSPSAQYDYYPDKKQLNIALFKRGFGGDYKQNFRGIKYFSPSLFAEDVENFRKNYINSFVQHESE